MFVMSNEQLAGNRAGYSFGYVHGILSLNNSKSGMGA